MAKGAVFLDRDGVINASPQERYVTSWSEFRFLPGVLTALRRLRRSGQTVVVVSNQAGVGRGVMPASALREITRRMRRRARRTGGFIRAVYYCTHRPADRCACRKPKLGLIRRACRRWPIDLKRSVVIGDHLADIAMGQAAGCRTVLVLSGATDRREAGKSGVRPDKISRNLGEAVAWILKAVS